MTIKGSLTELVIFEVSYFQDLFVYIISSFYFLKHIFRQLLHVLLELYSTNHKRLFNCGSSFLFVCLFFSILFTLYSLCYIRCTFLICGLNSLVWSDFFAYDNISLLMLISFNHYFTVQIFTLASYVFQS